MKTKYGEFNEYHTSGDDLNFVTSKGLNDSFNMYLKCIELIENNHIYSNKILCEPFMSKYDLYDSIGASKNRNIFSDILLLCRLIDSNNDLIDLSIKSKIETKKIYEIIKILLKKNIIFQKNI
jgi:aminopeptidase-like protein